MARRYAIFGGGLGGLSAAYKILKEEPGARVEIFETGWRLGGKLHSSESLAEPENKEHGLHILFGFYVNAFHLLYEAYEEIQDTPELRYRSLDDVIEPQSFGVVYDADADEEERQWLIQWPRDHQHPGHNDELPGEFESIEEMGRVLVKIAASLVDPENGGSLGESLFDIANSGTRAWLAEAYEIFAGSEISELEGAQEASGRSAPTTEQVRQQRKQVEEVHSHKPEGDQSIAEERAAILIEIAVGVVKGLLKVREETGSLNLNPLDKYSLSEWLEDNGVSKKAANSAFINMYREAAFGFRDGREDKPDFAAGAALRALIRIFAHFRGCVTWKLVAGAGEAVVAPVFLALRRMGACFRFYHRLEEVRWDAETETVKARLQKQAEVPKTVVYKYLRRRPAGGVYWPDSPDYDLLTNGEALKEWGGRLDDPNQVVPEGVAPPNSHFEISAGESADCDFDKFIVATGVGSLKSPASDGQYVFPSGDTRTKRLREVIGELGLVPTVAAQFGITRTMSKLGWEGSESSPGVSGMPRPLPIAADMTKAGLNPGTFYLCSAYPLKLYHLAEDVDEEATRAELFEKIAEWCETSGKWLYSRPSGSFEWDWNLLSDPEGREGRERLRAQYFRLNNLPVETCVGCHSGSNLHLPGPDDSGLPHVILAGAWTRTGVNLSSFEAAVMSGLRAARSALGASFEVPGEHFLN